MEILKARSAEINLALMNHPAVVRHMQRQLRRPLLDAIYWRMIAK